MVYKMFNYLYHWCTLLLVGGGRQARRLPPPKYLENKNNVKTCYIPNIKCWTHFVALPTFQYTDPQPLGNPKKKKMFSGFVKSVGKIPGFPQESLVALIYGSQVRSVSKETGCGLDAWLSIPRSNIWGFSLLCYKQNGSDLSPLASLHCTPGALMMNNFNASAFKMFDKRLL